MEADIRQATLADISRVSAVLCEAAAWLAQRGIPLWKQEELQPSAIQADVARGFYFLALESGSPVGTFKYQPEDPLHWPDAVPQEAAYIHRIAVRRSHSGGELASLLLRFAANRTRSEGRQYLRLDCDSARPKLRAIYERFGFVHHSDRQVGFYHVARYQLSAASAATSARTSW